MSCRRRRWGCLSWLAVIVAVPSLAVAYPWAAVAVGVALSLAILQPWRW